MPSIEVKQIAFEDDRVTIVYSENRDNRPWGSMTRLIEADMLKLGQPMMEFMDDCQTFIDSILVQLRDG